MVSWPRLQKELQISTFPFRIYHRSTNSTRPYLFRPHEMIDTSDLNQILVVDVDAMTALVEPNVPMDKLVESTLEVGLLPPVVMEFPGITVGGGFSGTGGESSSFRYGFFEQTVQSIEIILATGEVLTASPNYNSDLFLGAASSFGTLGVVTLLELSLVPAKPYVELTYYPVSSGREAVAKIQEEIVKENNSYVDGILFSKDRGVVCVGRLTPVPENSETKVQRFTRAHDPWFYLHAEHLIERRNAPQQETIPIVDYLFRYDRGGFWVGRFAFRYFLVPFNFFTRWFLDDFLHTRMMYHSLHQSGLHKRYFLQDVGIPFPVADQFLQYIDETMGYYPLWLCPLQQPPLSKRTLFYPSISSCTRTSTGFETFLNVGIWAIGPTHARDYETLNRQLEAKVQELGGRKWLYAQTYYSEGQFWDINDRDAYETLRNKYHATHLPSIYDKVRFVSKGKEAQRARFGGLWKVVWSIWPLRGLYGLFHAMVGWDYLLSTRSEGSAKNNKAVGGGN
jgi:Delta24-sterol reductase